MGSISSHFIRQVLRLSAAMVLGGLVHSAGAQVTAPVVLDLGDNAPRTLITLGSATLIGIESETYSDAEGFTIRLDSTVFTGSALNPFGADKMVFGYQVTNIAAPGAPPPSNTTVGFSAWGILNLKVFDFFANSVAVGEEVIYRTVGSSSVPGVVPGPTYRSTGGNIAFTYPPRGHSPWPNGDPPPPIYAGEFSNMLYVFTDADGFQGATATSLSGFLADAGTEDEFPLSQQFRTFYFNSLGPGPALEPPPESAPDSASTGILILAALALGVAGRRVGRGDRL